MTPMATGVMLVKNIAGKACSHVLQGLYDSGGSKSMCHSRVIPERARIRTKKQQLFCTMAGAYASKGNVQISGICLPAFDKNQKIDGHDFEAFEGDCAYDIILGGDFLEKIGMNLK